MHLLSDTIVAAGVVLTGIVIYYTGWYWVDTAISFVIAIIILVSTWHLLTDSIRLALDGVPKNIDIKKVESAILKFQDVLSVHHIHIWALSSSENALTAHLVIKDTHFGEFATTKHKIKHALEHLNIQHSTLEIENSICDQLNCDED